MVDYRRHGKRRRPNRPFARRTGAAGTGRSGKGRDRPEWLGVSVAKIHELARAGILARKRVGRGSIYDLRECILAYIDFVAHSPKTEATRLQQAWRVKLELETERLRGELVSAADVRTEWAALLTKIRGPLRNIVGQDWAGVLERIVWDEFSGPIRVLPSNRYLLIPESHPAMRRR